MQPKEERQTIEVREPVSHSGSAATPAAAHARTDRVPGTVLAARIVSFIGAAIVVLLLMRFILLLLGANPENTFADLIYAFSFPFAAPFFGLFSYEPAYSRSVIEVSTLIAMAVYALLASGIAKMLTLGRRDRDAV